MTGRSPAFTADMPKNQARRTGLVMPQSAEYDIMS